MAIILDGRVVRDKLKMELRGRVEALRQLLTLVIVQVGDREDSNIYIRNKIKFGREIGVEVRLQKFGEDITEESLIAEIKKLNNDENVNGVIVQLPLPKHLDEAKIVRSVDPKKDADGLSSIQDVLITPATARAVEELLNYYGIQINGKRVVVIGKSRLAGGPITELLQNRGAIVEVCDSHTNNVPEICRQSDIIISATGVANLITAEYVKPGQTVVDVGINRISPETIVGDVNFAEVEPIVGAISPVPGGVGPLTVACLFKNLLDLN